MINIIFPDNSVKEFKKGVKVLDVAKSISEGLARKVISASYNNEIIELETVLNENGELQTEGDVIKILTTIKNLYNKIL